LSLALQVDYFCEEACVAVEDWLRALTETVAAEVLEVGNGVRVLLVC
jgi:hypothetical protein